MLWGLYNKKGASLIGFLGEVEFELSSEGPAKKMGKDISRRENIMCQCSEVDENVAHL